MVVPANRYVVPSEVKPTEKARGSWLERLRRWVVKCPNCAEVRLVVGAQENESYVCRSCGHDFLITDSTLAPSNPRA